MKKLGWALVGLVAGIMQIAGVVQIFGPLPEQQNEQWGLAGSGEAIGLGCMASGLLLFPRTASLGLLSASAFWGGATCSEVAKSSPAPAAVTAAVVHS